MERRGECGWRRAAWAAATRGRLAASTASQTGSERDLVLAAFWILDPLYTALGYVLAWFYEVIPDYGVAIVLLTVAVRLVTFPLTAKQAKAQQALQKVQPELKRLQAKYKNDKQKLNEEMMRFYKENHVNPFGSCLPLLIQMPVLIVLYRLIIGLTGSAIVAVMIVAAVTTGPLAGVSVEGGQIKGGAISKAGVVTKGTLEGAVAKVNGSVVGTVAGAQVVNGKIPTAQVVNAKAVVGTLTDLSVQGGRLVGEPKHVPKNSSLQKALVHSGGTMDSFGMDLSKSAAKVTDSGVIPYFILILGVMATGYYQQRQLTARQPRNGGTNQQMQAIGKIFPVMFGVISYTIPAGVVVYFLVSNLWQIGQQAFIFRNQELPTPGSDSKKATPTKSDDRSGKGKPTPSAKANSKSQAKGRPSPRSNGKPGRRQGRGSTARDARSRNEQRNAADRRRAAPKSVPPKPSPPKDDK
jgi:YidC/Oxa1 family membrane protein insertase